MGEKLKVTIRNHSNGGKPVYKHNERDPEFIQRENESYMKRTGSDIGKIGSHYGSHETWGEAKTELQVYEELFSDSIAEYNARQKRKDRMKTVDSYYREVEQDSRGRIHTKRVKVDGKTKRIPDERIQKGKKTSYEAVISVNGVPDEVNKAVCMEYDATFEMRNPNFRKVRGDWHADEAGISHLHETYVPFSSGFKQGLDIQQSLNKALASMGFKSMIEWHEHEREYLRELTLEKYAEYCVSHGIDNPGIEWEMPYAGTDACSLETAQYARLKDWEKVLDEHDKYQDEREAELDKTDEELDKRDEELDAREDQLDDREESLDRREQALTDRKARIISKLSERKKGIHEKYLEVIAREQAVSVSEAQIATKEANLDESTKTAKRYEKALKTGYNNLISTAMEIGGKRNDISDKEEEAEKILDEMKRLMSETEKVNKRVKDKDAAMTLARNKQNATNKYQEITEIGTAARSVMLEGADLIDKWKADHKGLDLEL